MYDIMQCMIAYDSTETLENKGLYFDILQKDLRKLDINTNKNFAAIAGAGDNYADSVSVFYIQKALENLNEKGIVLVNINHDNTELKKMLREPILPPLPDLSLSMELYDNDVNKCSQSDRNYQKENSQQGWKNRPKHKR